MKKKSLKSIAEIERLLKVHKRELREKYGVKVDLVTRNALKPYIGRRILDEVRYV